MGHILNAAITDSVEPSEAGQVGMHHAGLWECDLADNSLIWSGGTYDIFGIPRGAQIRRDDAVALYVEHSRAAMERLRLHAIKHARGFTIDTQIRAANGQERCMRLIAAPICDGHRVIRLQGVKLLI